MQAIVKRGVSCPPVKDQGRGPVGKDWVAAVTCMVQKPTHKPIDVINESQVQANIKNHTQVSPTVAVFLNRCYFS